MDEIVGYRQEILSALEAVLDDLSEMITLMPAGAWQSSPRPGDRTPHYCLAHLHALESQVFALQLRRIVEEDAPRLPLFDDQSWMAEHYTTSQPAQEIFDEFSHLRRHEIAWLQDLPAGSWSRTARHPWWGVRTLQWWVELQLDYSRQHLLELSPSQSK